MRAFIAFELPEETRQSLRFLQDELRQAQSPVSWVGFESLHLTLKFLGEITSEQAQAVKESLQSVARVFSPFTVELGGLGGFPSLKAASVLWVGVLQGGEPATALAYAIEKENRRLFLPKEERPFSAHVTIGRLRNKASVLLLKKLQETHWRTPGPWQAKEVVLYQSVLSAQAAKHTVLARMAFGGKAAA